MSNNHKSDFNRANRIGFGETILCDSKQVTHLDSILTDAASNNHAMLMTRLSEDQLNALSTRHQARIDYDPISKTAWFGKTDNQVSERKPEVAIVSAGTSDVPVAKEAARTLGFSDIVCQEIYDVGVAGIWRLMERAEELAQFRVIIAVAGMDAALPSVLGGLVPGAIIAVPTSVGYGVATGGTAALHALLASCAPGIAVVNIDNGYGAACAALRILGAADTR